MLRYRPTRIKRESLVERRVCNEFNSETSHAYKFTSPGRRGVPDRLLLSSIDEEHRAIVARYVRFVEVKSSKGVLSEEQTREIKLLREWGFQVDVVR